MRLWSKVGLFPKAAAPKIGLNLVHAQQTSQQRLGLGANQAKVTDAAHVIGRGKIGARDDEPLLFEPIRETCSLVVKGRSFVGPDGKLDWHGGIETMIDRRKPVNFFVRYRDLVGEKRRL